MPLEKAIKWRLVLALAVVYLVWGSTYLGIRYAIETIPPLLMAGTRFLTAGLLLFAWSQWRGYGLPTRLHWRTAAILGFLMILGGNGGVTIAERQVSSGLAALLVSTEPLWLVLLSWARPRGAAPGAKQVAGLVIGFVGVAVLVGPGNLALTGGTVLPILLILGAAFSWALGSLYATGAPSPAPVVSNSIIMIAGGVFLLLGGVLHGEVPQVHFEKMSAVSITALLYLMTMGSLAAFSAYTYLLSATTPAMASSYAFVNPVVAVLLGWAVAGETVTSRSVFAMVGIVIAVLLLTAKHGPVKRSSEAERQEAVTSST